MMATHWRGGYAPRTHIVKILELLLYAHGVSTLFTESIILGAVYVN
jgi:hypothetical protein